MFPVPNKSLPCCKQNWDSPSIYKTGTCNRKFYDPQIVSFGPYHHGKSTLEPMEKHKEHALQHFLNRSQETTVSLVKSLGEVPLDLEKSYQTLDEKWKKLGKKGKKDEENGFLEMMIRDGCFMLEIMRAKVEDMRYYAPNNPKFNIYRRKYITAIQRDMLLLENQLPLGVLYWLVAKENNGEERDQYDYISELILKFYSLNKDVRGMDVYRKGLLREPRKVPDEQEDEKPLAVEEIIQSATELEAWIRFEKIENGYLDDISFSEGGLRLPCIKVDDATHSIFLNLMTFERLHVGVGNEITSYVTFMDKIINNKRDVKLLLAQGIIKNAPGSNTEVAKLFNSLCAEVPLPSNRRLNDVQKKIYEYGQKPCNKGRATLKRWWIKFYSTYFSSPWSILSLTAAIFLFALTITQTVYAVLSYNSQIGSV